MSAIFLMSVIKDKDASVLLKDKNLFFLAAFIITALISVTASALPLKSLHAVFFKWAKYLAIYLMAGYAVIKGFNYKRAGLIILVSSLIVCADAVFQYAAGYDLISHRELVVTSYKPIKLMTASLNHPNSLAAFLLIPIFIVFFKMFSTRRMLGRVFNVLLYSSFVLVLLFTFSRAAIASFVVSSLFALFWLYKIAPEKKRYILFTACFFAMICIAILILWNIYNFTFFKNLSILALWDGSSKILNGHFLTGIGVGTFMDASAKAGLGLQYLHNSYLQVLVEQGIFGLLALLVFIYITVKDAFNAAYKSKDIILGSFLFGIAAFLMQSFFDVNLYSLKLSFLFWGIMGLIRGMTVRESRAKDIVV